MTAIWHLLRYGTWDHDLYLGRDDQGRLVDACLLCGYARPVLTGKTIIGPAHQGTPDVGSVRTKARKMNKTIALRSRRAQ